MHATDLDLTGKDIGELTSSDAFTAFLTKLGYRTTGRTHLTPESIGLAGDSAAAFKKIELLSEDEEQFLRVVFAQPRSLTAKARNDLARVLGKTTIDHLLILASDYETLEFVLLDKRKKEQQTGGERVQVVPKIMWRHRSDRPLGPRPEGAAVSRPHRPHAVPHGGPDGRRGAGTRSAPGGNVVSRRDKLVEKMRNTPKDIRFGQVASLLRYEGFVLFNKRGSHRTYHHFDGRVITIVVPHGKRKTCHPDDIRKLLEVLGL